MSEFQNAPEATVRSTGTRYGVLLGLVSFVYFIVLNMMGMDATQGWARWASLLLSVGLLVLAHLYYRDNGNGYMSFGQGVSISFWIGLVAGLIAVAGTLAYIEFVDTGYMERISDLQRQAMEEQGLEEEQIEQALDMSAKFMTPGFFFLFGLIGNVVMTVLMGLLISIFTQRPDTRMPE